MSNTMTPERAIEILNPEHREHYDSIETVNEACRMGMEAIGYRTSKKVNDIERFRNDIGCIAQKGKCPCCNMIVIDYIDGYGDVDSCFHCGQALDWRDEE